MPIAVDHNARRQQVVSVAMGLIAQAGLEAVTVRDVAIAAGCSTAIVSHYFRNKKELLYLTYRATIDRASQRASNAHDASGGDIKAFLAQIMPLDTERLTEWKIWLAFWAKAAADPEIAADQRACVSRTRDDIRRMLSDLDKRGDLLAEADIDHVARRALATITGMAVQVMFDPEDWPAERQHDLIDRDLAAIFRPGRLPASIRPLEPLSVRPVRPAMAIAS